MCARSGQLISLFNAMERNTARFRLWFLVSGQKQCQLTIVRCPVSGHSADAIYKSFCLSAQGAGKHNHLGFLCFFPA